MAPWRSAPPGSLPHRCRTHRTPRHGLPLPRTSSAEPSTGTRHMDTSVRSRRTLPAHPTSADESQPRRRVRRTVQARVCHLSRPPAPATPPCCCAFARTGSVIRDQSPAGCAPCSGRCGGYLEGRAQNMPLTCGNAILDDATGDTSSCNRRPFMMQLETAHDATGDGSLFPGGTARCPAWTVGLRNTVVQ